MPTSGVTDQFKRDYSTLGPTEKAEFKESVADFVEDLRAGGNFRQGLRVKSMKGAPGIFEMTWEIRNGRATFQYGEPVIDDEKHIIWRRIGGHEIFGAP